MPFGRLREYRQGAKRADKIVYTKCPDLNREELASAQLRFTEGEPLFSKIIYSELQRVHEGSGGSIDSPLLVTSIARPGYLFDHLSKQFEGLNHKKYRDHYSFSQKDLDQLASQSTHIICTDKDWAKLKSLNMPEDTSIWVQSIKLQFEGEDLGDFIEQRLGN